MSDQPRRSKLPPSPDAPTGYRSTRRGAKALKQAKKAEKQHQRVVTAHRLSRRVRNFLLVVLQMLAAVGMTVLVLLLVASLINGAVRWNARRLATADGGDERERQARENVLVIGVDGDKAVGFLAMRVDGTGKQVFGIAVPEGAFLDVPGQGFQRIGDSYAAGPDVVSAAISNYLTVPFRSYIVVPAPVYRDALTRQVVNGIPEASISSNIKETDLSALSEALARIPQKNVALVPMPTRPIKLGDQTYLEPQKEEVADLLKSWWGVDPNSGKSATRVVVFNGAGKAGIAGEAAQQLIRAGVRVVDTQNADSFDYATTKIVVRRGDEKTGESVRKVLGVGEVSLEPSDADVTDVVVIIGKDYVPPADKEGN